MTPRRMRRAVGCSVLIALISLVGPISTRAAGGLWTLVVLPPTAIMGQLTTYTLTATNVAVLNETGCLEVDLPPSFQDVSAMIGQTPEGRPWTTAVNGTNVVVSSESGGGRLELLQSVIFTITARATASGLMSWPNHAHERKDCTGPDITGVSLPVTVVPQLLPTPIPTPIPTAMLTPVPTPRATPVSTLAPTLTPRPSAVVPPRPIEPATPPAELERPSSSEPPAQATTSPSRSAAATPTAEPTANGATPDQSNEPLALAAAPILPPPSPGLSIASTENELGIELTSVGTFAGVETWGVPAATLGLPGLLVLLWVALQAAGAFAWVPAVRRLRGDDEEPGASRRVSGGSSH